MEKKHHPDQENPTADYEPIASATECTGLIPAGSSFDETAESYQAIFPIPLAEEPVMPSEKARTSSKE